MVFMGAFYFDEVGVPCFSIVKFKALLFWEECGSLDISTF